MFQKKRVFINEINYHLEGTFVNGKFVEIAYETGEDVSQFYIELYNGETGESYGDTLVVSTDGTQGTDDAGGLSFVVFSTPDIRSTASGNGVALVDGLTDRVVDFISYDGQFVATTGAANTMESVDIGVSQADIISSDGILSLQLSGLGCLGSDFTWEVPQLQTPGGLNRQQTATCIALEPSADPSVFPSLAPSMLPSVLPSKAPSDLPSVSPSMRPSNEPSETPSVSPSLTPSAVPSAPPSEQGPSDRPSEEPSAAPSVQPAVSSPANLVSAPQATGPRMDTCCLQCWCVLQANIFINEVHYWNRGTDVGEFVELAYETGEDVSQYYLLLYNGRNGQTYGTYLVSDAVVSGVSSGGLSFVYFDLPGLQHSQSTGEGIALVDGGSGAVIEFISYDGHSLRRRVQRMVWSR